MAFTNLKKQTQQRRMWALIGRAGAGKSTFLTQCRGPLVVVDPDGRFGEVARLCAEEVLGISDDEGMPAVKAGTIVLDSMTAILAPIVARVQEEIARGEHQNKAAAWKPKAQAVKIVQDALAKWGTDFVVVYHEQDSLDGQGRMHVVNTVSPLEEARLMRSLNATIRLGQDGRGRFAEVVWCRSGRTGRVYDEAGSWKGVPDKLDGLMWSNLTASEQAVAGGQEPPAYFTNPQDAWQWGFAQGCFRDMRHAQNAYEELKREKKPADAGEMRNLWVDEVQARVARQENGNGHGEAVHSEARAALLARIDDLAHKLDAAGDCVTIDPAFLDSGSIEELDVFQASLQHRLSITIPEAGSKGLRR
jgi:hypothetical protein